MKDANELLVARGPEGFAKAWTQLVSAARTGAAPLAISSVASVESVPAPVRVVAPAPPPAPPPAARREETRETAAKEENLSVAPELVSQDGAYVLTCGARAYRVRGLTAFGVDRLRVNVHVDEGPHFHVDTFDLYSARSRHAFVEAAVRALRIDDGQLVDVASEIDQLILALEKERLSLRKEGKGESKEPVMTAQGREEALSFLKASNLIALLLADFDAMGCVGEKETLLTGYFALVSRFLPSPLSVLFCARSGAGKSVLQDTLCELVPPEDLIKYTRISGQVLFYKAENALVRKVLAVEEEGGANQAAYALRSLLSSGYLSSSVTRTDPQTGRHVDDDRRVNGPTTVFLTSAHPETLDYETRNRFVLLTIDESKEQTERILTRQLFGETLEGLIASERRKTILDRHHNAQRLLEPLRVVIPFDVRFPRGSLILRREQKKYLTLLKAIALLHQHQRPRKTALIDGRSVEYIEVEEKDVAVARPLASLILRRNLDELAPPARSLYVAMRDLARVKKAALPKVRETPKPGAPRRYVLANDGRDERLCLERREIQRSTGLSLWHIKTYLPQLIEYEYVEQVSGSKGKRCLYFVLDVEETEDLDL